MRLFYPPNLCNVTTSVRPTTASTWDKPGPNERLTGIRLGDRSVKDFSRIQGLEMISRWISSAL